MGQFTYLFLILIWAGPLILLQWLLGGDLLLRRWKVWIPGIIIPTLYLTVVDSFALRATTWIISPAFSLGIFLPVINVPLEEGIFFLVTNTLVVQGLLFILTPQMRGRVARVAGLLRRGPRIKPNSK